MAEKNEQKKKNNFNMYLPENNKVAGVGDFDDRIEKIEWRFDEETKNLKPFVAEEQHIQDIVDSFIGQDVLSQLRKLEAASFGQAIEEGINTGIFTPARPQTEDINLDELPKSRADVLRLQRKAQEEASQVNEALGLDFSVSEYAQGLADQAIKEFIKSKFEQLTPKEGGIE